MMGDDPNTGRFVNAFLTASLSGGTMSLILLTLLLVIGVIAFLILSAVGHVSGAVTALAARQEELFLKSEESADERKQHINTYLGKALIEERLLPHLGFEEPEPSEQERQFNAMVSSAEFQRVVEEDAKEEFEKVHGAGSWDASEEVTHA
jgi:hypothetical protein